ncbi:TIGR03016 family PEP-CTERM system-associated outer membrane protein [Alteromonas sp. CYL-A6]|uniref:TIGR03016 family PEP-CTERM system-associated outer membrane protein n=1 Tax=Alteromonas nitratireducens TaxID=3390813 RepID=UPI0034ADE5C2
MAIITLSAMTNALPSHSRISRHVLACAIASALLVPVSVQAAGLDVRARVSAKTIFQELKPAEQQKRSLTTLSIEPEVTATYESRTLNGLWQGSLNHLDRDREDVGQTDNYGEYNYDVRWTPLDNLLLFQANGALTYQNANAANFLVTDVLTNSQNLVKARSNRYSASLQLNNGNYVRGTGTLSYSDVQTERAVFTNNQGLDNDTYLASGSLRNGERASRLIWNVNGDYVVTKRNGFVSFQSDFISRSGDAAVDYMVLRNWGVRVNAAHEANQLSQRTDTASRVREFNSYGIGLTYRQGENRYIAVTANQTDSSVAEDDNIDFVGVDMAWALSSRSDVAAKYSRRFFGETAQASFNYNTKHFRSSFRYSEDVTNTSRLLANPENLGVFVCPVDSSALAECFQPASLGYQPGSSERLVQLTTQNIEFDDNIIVRKSGNGELGYSFSRVTLGISGRYSEDNFIDDDRLIRTYSGGVSLAYSLGSYTQLTAKVDYADIEQRSTDLQSGSSQNWNSKIGLRREIGRYLVADLDFSYLDKRGDLAIGSLFGPEYTDRRVSLSISYRYE